MLLPTIYGFGGERKTVALCGVLLGEIEGSDGVRLCPELRCWRGSATGIGIGDGGPPAPGRKIEGSTETCDDMNSGGEWVFGIAALECTGSSDSKADKEPFFIGGTVLLD